MAVVVFAILATSEGGHWHSTHPSTSRSDDVARAARSRSRSRSLRLQKSAMSSTGRCLRRHSIVFKGVTIRRTGKPFYQGCLCHCRPTNINKHAFFNHNG